MRAPGLVIFDCDGVLVDSEPISMRVLTDAIGAVGVPMPLEEVHATFVGTDFATIEREVSRRRGAPVPDGWMDEFYAVRAEVFERELRPIAGARAAVEGVRADGWETCVASQGRPAKMEQTLGLTGLSDLFAAQRIFSATMVERPKPAPDLFLYAARSCGWEPGECVVVEDSLLGIRGARAAGMRVLGYLPAGAPEDAALPLLAAGAEVVRSLDEVPGRVA
ncbi:HAD family hydrolase [Conexibacter arvalis]|uniref:HAD superfamily hydrolase (TIGR01509 family) n=1 Tax=Conexibacter arvalis TaxID=912552 RepID=A0A840IHK3_9ACTN|nr:HAD family hydrolase [Conexibacter arvalis]MBB4663428.1 HAD superfamily hydrolase (TIGR01509 family) [Conexibacter arvalis]